MALIDIPQYRSELAEIRKSLLAAGDALHIDHIREQLDELTEEMNQPEFWNDPDHSAKVNQKVSNLKGKLEHYEKLLSSADDIEVMLEMAEEEKDEDTVTEAVDELATLKEHTDALELETLMRGDYDDNDAVLSLHAGAGGTEAQDWTSMLFRMYTRYCEKMGFTVKLLDLLDGEFLAWHLSGGTSELLHVKCGADGLPDCTCIGGTTDLAAGQLLDRAGNLLGLPFPSGGALDALALTAEPEKGFKPKVNECKFSLSGMQNQVENKFKTAEPKQMARFALETVANAVIKATEQAREQYHCPILCAGGVMASQIIRARMNKRFGGEVSFAEPTLSGDNAVGVAVLAAKLCNR